MNNMNPLRKSQSLHNVDQPDQFLLINKSRVNLTVEQNNIIDSFIKVNLSLFLFI